MLQRIGPTALLCVLTGGGAACVDSTKHGAPDGGIGPQPATCQAPAAVTGTTNAVIPAGDTAVPGPYAWKNVVIKGGGFVSGIVMSPALRGLAFARTDVGGAYRFDPTGGRWTPITDWVGHANSNLTGIESLAVDPIDPNRVYIAAGEYLNGGNGAILSSTDMGQTWVTNPIGAPMGGNADGRSMGERLAVDPNLPTTIFFGSRNAGLWVSTDSATTWSSVASFPTIGATNGGAGSGNSGGTGYGLTFVAFDAASGAPGSATPALYVGVGLATGSALYRSLDAGATWDALAGVPSAAAGMMPHHAAFDGCGNLYLAFNDGSGPNNVKSGLVLRYDTAGSTWTNVSPPAGAGGFGGLAADPAHPGTLLVTTIDRWSPDVIYRTTDGGVHWISVGGAFDDNGADWLTFGGGSVSATGWMGDVAIDPFDSAHALYITGQGLWSSQDVTAADTGTATHWTFADDGLEETVVLDLATPPGTPLLSGVGDIGGFRHDDLDTSPARGMFTNPVFGNTSSLDFAEGRPNVVARVGTSSRGTTGAYSTNGGADWTPFAGPPAVAGTAGPSAGSIAISADGKTFVWAPARNNLSTPTPSYSIDNGAHWMASAGLNAGAQVAADRVNPLKFYASGKGAMLVSTDGGVTFTAVTTSASGRPRPVFGVEGDVWVATSSGLLHSSDSGATFPAVIGVSGATAVGFGAPVQPGQTYPSVYLAGAVSGVWGLYRSDDAGASWMHIDDPQHQFGYINCLAGDRTTAGRVYLGTSGRGIVYGDPRAAVSP